MEKIASFTIDHTILPKGMYLSRKDAGTVTYDLRFRKPNLERVMENSGIHTLEHLFATYVRNSEFADKIIYFGPMGCRTGFYFITTDTLPASDAVELTKKALRFCADFEGDVPGVSAVECGNYLDHDLFLAKKESALMCEVLEGWDETKLQYPTKE